MRNATSAMGAAAVMIATGNIGFHLASPTRGRRQEDGDTEQALRARATEQHTWNEAVEAKRAAKKARNL